MLEIKNVFKSFGQKMVLDHLNLEVQEGSIFGLVGVNGAGKSTLLRLIAGVYEPDAGTIVFNGEDTYNNENIRADIAFVSDETRFPHGATIASMKVLYKTMYRFDENRYQKYLKLFELDPKASIVTLSKGMKRRVSLLFALSICPKLLLLDEAYDGLEPLARLRFKQALVELIEDEKNTVIISGHNLKELEDICDSFGILEEGKIMTYGDLLTSRQLINKYQLAFSHPVKREDFASFEVMHFESEGSVVKLVIKGEEEMVSEKLKEMHPLIMDELPVNFEELFIYELESRGEGHE